MHPIILILTAIACVYAFFRLYYGNHVVKAMYDFVYRASDGWREREKWMDEQPSANRLIFSIWRSPVSMMHGRYLSDFNAYLND